MTIDVRAAGLSLFSPEIERYLGDGDNSGAFEDGNCSRELLAVEEPGEDLHSVWTWRFPDFLFLEQQAYLLLTHSECDRGDRLGSS